MAEWLGSALQKLLQRFESASDLQPQKAPSIRLGFFCAQNLRPSLLESEAKGAKTASAPRGAPELSGVESSPLSRHRRPQGGNPSIFASPVSRQQIKKIVKVGAPVSVDVWRAIHNHALTQLNVILRPWTAETEVTRTIVVGRLGVEVACLFDCTTQKTIRNHIAVNKGDQHIAISDIRTLCFCYDFRAF